MTSPVTVEIRDNVTIISLSRPEKANALSGEMSDGIRDAILAATAAGARAVVLRGEGKHFCAGFDFGDFDSLTDGDLALRFLQVEEMLQAVFYAPMPVLALVQGRAVGTGADLAAAAMRVVAAPGALHDDIISARGPETADGVRAESIDYGVRERDANEDRRSTCEAARPVDVGRQHHAVRKH